VSAEERVLEVVAHVRAPRAPLAVRSRNLTGRMAAARADLVERPEWREAVERARVDETLCRVPRYHRAVCTRPN